MQRACYNPINFEGFATGKVESIAMVAGGNRLFVGTGDGNLLAYECRMDNNIKYTCTSSNVIRKSKERKAAYTSLQIFETWRIVVGIIDGIIMAYDTHTCQCLSQLLDSKNCTLFSVHEQNSFMAVANKRKVSFYLWQGSGFVPQREIALNETPKFLHCVSGCVIVGYKRSYDVINLTNYSSTHLLDVEKEHAMVGCDIPAGSRRGTCVLLSVGSHGVLVENVKHRPGILRERVEWSAAPVAMRTASPFNLVSLLSSQVIEVHDLSSLVVLQTINISFDSPMTGATLGDVLSWKSAAADSMSLSLYKASKKSEEHIIVSSGDKVSAFSMIPIHNQIMSLTADGHYEAALDLYNLSPKEGSVLDVQVNKIHEMYAHLLHSKGDFEGAIRNFIDANGSAATVLSLFPEFVPGVYHSYCKGAAAQSTAFVKAAAKLSDGGDRPAMTGTVLARAAAAIVTFCEHHRESADRRASAAEKIRSAGMGGVQGSDKESSSKTVSDEVFNADVDDMIKIAELIDSTLLTALVICSPSRTDSVVDMLSKSNRCHSETSAVMLASRGKTYTEALLWLYRSNGEHRRVLAALTEERCVDSGAWTKEEFYTWVTVYLRWLWFSEDTSLPSLALQSLRQVIEYDADLGMSVLVLRPKGVNSLGGKGLTLTEVLATLGSLTPAADSSLRQEMITEAISITMQKAVVPPKDVKPAANAARIHKQTYAYGGIMTPLVNGQALCVNYVEWLVGTGTSAVNIYDEFVQLLIQSIPMQHKDVDHSMNALDFVTGESEESCLYKIYRRKLQFFLQNSRDYRANIVVKFLPPDFLHEHALLLSNQGLHEEVIAIYVNRLHDLALATTYCDRIYSKQHSKSGESEGTSSSNGNGTDTIVDIYICLFRVILAAEEYVRGDPILDANTTIPESKKNLTYVIRVAERHYDRFSPIAFLALMKQDIPLAEIAFYLHIVIEYTNTKKKNLKVLHQIMRMREVHLRTESSPPV